MARKKCSGYKISHYRSLNLSLKYLNSYAIKLHGVEKLSNKNNSSNHYIKLTNKLLKKFDKNFDNHDFTEIYKLWEGKIKK